MLTPAPSAVALLDVEALTALDRRVLSCDSATTESADQAL
jgi:hypothetical protein